MTELLRDDDPMALALELAKRGEGAVEPNPMVGCVLVADSVIVGRGWHQTFGGPHAEVNALQDAGEKAHGATAYVTLEPCRHHGKTPPCTDALIAAGVRRVVVALADPNPEVAGRGAKQLREAGLEVELGHGQAEAEQLAAPYLKLRRTGRPWVIAKWAMSLDGKIATRTGDSRWISGELSRQWVHHKRGCVDAVMVGAGTLVADDPLLTARPAGTRRPTRVVVAGEKELPLDRQLFHSLDEGPVSVFVAESYPESSRSELESLGVEVVTTEVDSYTAIMDELGRRQMTNVFVEGGGKLLGRLFDQRLVDETHIFISPCLIGGAGATSPVEGVGAEKLCEALKIHNFHTETSGEDLHLWGRFG